MLSASTPPFDDLLLSTAEKLFVDQMIKKQKSTVQALKHTTTCNALHALLRLAQKLCLYHSLPENFYVKLCELFSATAWTTTLYHVSVLSLTAFHKLKCVRGSRE